MAQFMTIIFGFLVLTLTGCPLGDNSANTDVSEQRSTSVPEVIEDTLESSVDGDSTKPIQAERQETKEPSAPIEVIVDTGHKDESEPPEENSSLKNITLSIDESTVSIQNLSDSTGKAIDTVSIIASISEGSRIPESCQDDEAIYVTGAELANLDLEPNSVYIIAVCAILGSEDDVYQTSPIILAQKIVTKATSAEILSAEYTNTGKLNLTISSNQNPDYTMYAIYAKSTDENAATSGWIDIINQKLSPDQQSWMKINATDNPYFVSSNTEDQSSKLSFDFLQKIDSYEYQIYVMNLNGYESSPSEFMTAINIDADPDPGHADDDDRADPKDDKNDKPTKIDHKKSLKIALAELKTLKKERAKAKIARAKLIKKNKSTHRNIVNSRDQIKKIKSKAKADVDKIEKYKNDIAAYKLEIVSTKEQVKSLRAEIQAMKPTIKEKIQEIRSLKKDIKEERRQQKKKA